MPRPRTYEFSFPDANRTRLTATDLVIAPIGTVKFQNESEGTSDVAADLVGYYGQSKTSGSLRDVFVPAAVSPQTITVPADHGPERPNHASARR